jgi:hypothetical protein
MSADRQAGTTERHMDGFEGLGDMYGSIMSSYSEREISSDK